MQKIQFKERTVLMPTVKDSHGFEALVDYSLSLSTQDQKTFKTIIYYFSA